MSENVQEKVKKSRPLKCVVVSASMQKSRVGLVQRLVKEGRVGKYLRRQTKIMFHDEQEQAKVGDEVLITPCRPYSARKRFTLVEVTKTGDRE